MSNANTVSGRSLKGILSVLLTVALFITCFCAVPSAAAAGDAQSFLDSITSDYSAALSMAGRSSFHGSCNLATAYQLRVKGIYSGGLDYYGGGDTWYAYYNGLTARDPSFKTSGGYYAVTYGGADCLSSLIADYGQDIRNVVYCLGTGGSSGTTHVMLISGIINGYVFFADSFGYYYNGYKSEGTGMCMPLSEFIAAYVKMNGYPHGCVYFTSDKTKTPGKTYSGTQLLNNPLSSGNPTPTDYGTGLDTWEDPGLDVVEDTPYEYYEPGVYLVTSDTNVYRDAQNYYKTGTVSSGDAVSITGIAGSRGKLENGGYISLDNVTFYPVPAIVSATPEKAYYTGASASMKWTVKAEGGIGDLTFGYTLYDEDGKKMASAKNENGVFTYKPKATGTFTLWVTVSDSNGMSSTRVAEPVGFKKTNTSASPAGDADGDGKVTAADSRMILRVSASLDSFKTSAARKLADVDKDNRITAADARAVLRISAKLQ